MLDKDKLYIIAYIGINGISDCDVPKFIRSATECISNGFDESVKFLVIPTRNNDTHVEFFNKEVLEKMSQEKIESIFERLQKSLEE